MNSPRDDRKRDETGIPEECGGIVRFSFDGHKGVRHSHSMQVSAQDESAEDGVEEFLDDVRRVMSDSLASTALGALLENSGNVIATGKMLRSRLAYRLSDAGLVSAEDMTHAAAAVEMVHAASLLHDDVIDGGMIRRGSPTFWLERGISGAILLGDLLLFKALDITCKQHAHKHWTNRLVEMTGQVCEAESEQELLLRGSQPTWDRCVRIARYKTGALFSFVSFAAAGGETALEAALTEAGYAIGTAYQLADDVLDATGSEQESGKTLGTDGARDKVTAISAAEFGDVDPLEKIQEFCNLPTGLLAPWPAVSEAWNAYLEADFNPSINGLLSSLAKAQASA